MDGGKGDIRLSQIASQLVMLYIALLSLLFGSPCSADLPEELDAFLEVLFDKSECEEFLSDSGWVSVATHTCAPYECDFPRQLCMRPSGKFKDESSNECRNIPEACLTAANEGVPLGTSAPKQVSLETPSPLPTVLTITPPSLITATTELKGGSIEQKKPWGLPTVTSICDMGEPQGRFCGFQAKIAYNRETGRCEQFWFPGCTTADTNANLFDTEEECIEATRSCAGLRPHVVTAVLPSPAPPLFSSSPSPPPSPVFPLLPPSIPAPPPIPPSLRPVPTSSFPFSNFFKGVGSVNNGPNAMGANQAILGLISNGISQFTGVGGAENGGGFLDGLNFAQIPQLIQTIQSVSGKR